MKAYYLANKEKITTEELQQQGIHYQFIADDENLQPQLDSWKAKQNYAAQDEVKLNPETPNLDSILEKFEAEHLHTDDEARYIVSGEGIFDIRSKDNQWMRVLVEAGDLIIVPAHFYHRFTLTESKTIHAIRLFQENPSWEPIYRESSQSEAS